MSTLTCLENLVIFSFKVGSRKNKTDLNILLLVIKESTFYVLLASSEAKPAVIANDRESPARITCLVQVLITYFFLLSSDRIFAHTKFSYDTS